MEEIITDLTLEMEKSNKGTTETQEKTIPNR